MKLLHIIASLEIGGAQRLLSDLLPIQKILNTNVALLVYTRDDNSFLKKIENANVKIISLEERSIYNYKNIFKLRKILRNYDVIHVHLFPSIYWVAIASIGLNIKLVYTEHSTHNRRRDRSYFRPIEKFIYNKYHKIISISQQTQDNLRRWLKIKENDSRFVVINNGIDIASFNVELPLSIVKRKIIMVSRFAQMKDQETVIKSMVWVNEGVELLLVGDGPNRMHCEKVACELGVSDRVKFLGVRSDIPQLVAGAYIGVQSSKWEGFGLTAVEIMAAHKPVIATNVEGLKQVVEGAGYLFEVGDAKTLASYINKLLEDVNLYAVIADRCYERAKEYDISKMATRYQDVYNELLKQIK